MHNNCLNNFQNMPGQMNSEKINAFRNKHELEYKRH